jgi:molecular chaperone HtpG
MDNERNYRVNIRNLVELLGERLYAEPSIVIRELISNASDASLFSKRPKGDDFRITIYHEPPDQLVIRDYGCGMTGEQLEDHLAVVANDGKRRECLRLRQSGQADFVSRIIGEFGVGFLSAFVVSKRVVVETVPESSTDWWGWRWESTGDTKYQITKFQGNAPGTTVRLFLNLKKYGQFNQARYVNDQAKRYSRLITVPIFYGTGEEADLLNPSQAPWDAAGPSGPKRWQEFLVGLDSYQDAADWLDVVVLSDSDVQGVLYFPYFNAAPQHPPGFVNIYCKGVLVEENNGEIVPRSIKCVRGMIQSADFQLQLDRGAILRNELFARVQSTLETAVLGHLTALASRDDPAKRERLARILDVHAATLMEGCLALEDEEVFCRIAEMLHIPTTHYHETTIPAYLERARRNPSQDAQERIFYSTQRFGGRQVAALVRKRNWEIVDCYNNLYRLFLERYTSLKNIRLHNVADDLDLFFDVVEPQGGWKDIVNLYQEMVHTGQRHEARLALCQTNEMPLSLLEQPGPSKPTVDGLVAGAKVERRILYINKSNPLLQRLVSQIEAQTIDPELLEMILHECFHLTCLFSDQSIESVHLFEHQQKVLNDLASLSDLNKRMDKDRLAQREQQSKLRDDILSLTKQLREAKDESLASEPAESEDSTVFVGIPFRAPYNEVYEEGIKPTVTQLGLKPVMLAEVVKPGSIPNDIHVGILQATAAIFDVSEPNANVYYELGLAHGLRKLDRTILICTEKAIEHLSFDARHLRTLSYELTPRQFKDFRERLNASLQEIIGRNDVGVSSP